MRTIDVKIPNYVEQDPNLQLEREQAIIDAMRGYDFTDHQCVEILSLLSTIPTTVGYYRTLTKLKEIIDNMRVL